MVKVVKTRSSSPPSYVHSFLSATKHLEKVLLNMVFTLFVNILKNVFWTNQNLKFLKNVQSFFILTTSTDIKNHKTKFEAGCSNNDCNLFVPYNFFWRIIVYDKK